MKKGQTLRQNLILAFLAVGLIPIIVFGVISQINIQQGIKSNLDDRIESNLHITDESLSIMLDKYSSILYDLCTDSDVLESIEKMNTGEDILEVSAGTIRRELSHICSQNTGILGITIQTKSGQIIFYDRLISSSDTSSWADKVRIPEVEKGEVFQGGNGPVEVGGEQYYMFQIARNLVDYRDIRESLGTVVLSMNEELIKRVLTPDTDSEVYLLDGDVIVSAVDSEDIGKDIREVQNTKDNEYSETVNQMSGMTLCNRQSLTEYRYMIYQQIFVLFLVALVTIFIVILLIYLVSRPYLDTVDDFIETMGYVEQGDFGVKIGVERYMPVEIRKIAEGFNEMTIHIEELISQVKSAVVEQKNAELSALEAQIDPHFLYNTLDTINWKAIERDEYEISEMVGALADILRYTVKNSGGKATVDQEISWLLQYIKLQSAKLAKEIDVNIKIDDELKGVSIHKLLLQPFVENSIKYGFDGEEESRLLMIQMKALEDQIHILIQDNGKGIEPGLLEKLNNEKEELAGHLGIANVRKRLKLYYGEQAEVFFESETGVYTKVHIFIPSFIQTEKEDICEL